MFLLAIHLNVKGVVHFKKKKLLLIIYSPPCHPRCMSLFLQRTKWTEWLTKDLFILMNDFEHTEKKNLLD